MRQHEQRNLDAFRRIQGFLDGHAAQVGEINRSEERAVLDAAVTAIADHVDSQGSSNRILGGALSRQRALVQELIRANMGPIAKFARAKLAGVPEYQALTASADARKPTEAVRAARAMAIAATPHLDKFATSGLSAGVVDRLTAVADKLDQVIVERANLKVKRVGSTKGISETVAEGRRAAQMLDASITAKFAGDATFLATWKAALRVLGKPGVPRSGYGRVVPAAAPAGEKADV